MRNMRVTVHCTECGHQGMRVLRTFDTPETFWVVCEHCEAPLKVVLTATDFANAQPLTPVRGGR